MTSHERLDKILNDYIIGIPDIDWNHSANDLRYLASRGYLDLSITETNEIFLADLTQEGYKFLYEGGFTAEYEKKIKEENDKALQRENWKTTTKTSKWAIWISLLSLLVSSLALYLAWRS